MIRNVITLLIFNFVFFACDTSVNNSESKTNSVNQYKKFFDYDEIDYYFNNYDEEKLFELYDNQSKSELDSIKMGVILGDIPMDTTHFNFVEKLETIGYQKKVIDNSKYTIIDAIFMEKTIKEILKTACINVYRDLLVFKKNSKVIGVAKICFGCLDHQIIGTNAETRYFGQNGDYAKLQIALRH